MPRFEDGASSSSAGDLEKNYKYTQMFIDEHFSNSFVMKIRKDESGRESVLMFEGKIKDYNFASPVSMLQLHQAFVHEVNNMWLSWRSAVA